MSQLAETTDWPIHTVTTADGFILDAETGEVLGHAQENDERFSRDYAEWVLERMTDVQAAIAVDEMKLRAIAINIDTRIRQQQARLDWLHRRFGADLEEFARRELAGTRGRSVFLDHGKLGFRRTTVSVKVLNMETAVLWAEVCAPEAVKTSKSVKSVLVGTLKGRDDLPAGAFEVTPPEDRFSVETGIKS